MRATKYITSIILTLAILAFVGETYVWHLSEFEVQYDVVTFYMQKDTTQQEMVSDLASAAKRRNVEFFTIDRKVESIVQEKAVLYGTDGIKKDLQDTVDVTEGTFESIFLGKTNINIQPIEDIPDISVAEYFYVKGDSESVVKFKKDLVDKYAGAFPREGYEPFNSKLNIALVWICVLLLFLLMTLYHVALMKKEMIVRLISGERLLYFVGKNILQDTVFYLLLFCFLIPIMGFFTNTTYHLGVSVICILAFLILNGLTYGWLLITDYKRDMATKSSAKKVLRISYVYKVFSIVITVIVMAGAISLIYEGIQCYKQRGFFEDHKAYSYITLSSFDEKKAAQLGDLSNQLYYTYLQQGKTAALVGLSDFEMEDHNYIYADRGSISYLKKQIPELSEMKIEEKVYLIKPGHYSDSGNAHDKSKEVFEGYTEGSHRSTMGIPYEEITYQVPAECIALNGEDGVTSELRKNPVILLDNLPIDRTNVLDVYIGQTVMFKMPEKEWSELIQKYDLKNEVAYKTNAYENYLHHWEILQRGMAIGIALLGIMLLLEGIIIRTMLKYEYSVNAMELAVKKIMGYGLFARQKKIFKMTIICGGTGIALAAAASVILDFGAYLFVLIGGAAVIGLEMAMTAGYIFKLEKQTVQRILKGGQL